MTDVTCGQPRTEALADQTAFTETGESVKEVLFESATRAVNILRFVVDSFGMKSAKPQTAKATILFRAKLIPSRTNGKTESWTLTLPKNASSKFPSRGVTIVEGAINAFPFRAALEPNGKGGHCLTVNKIMRAGAGAGAEKGAADLVTVEIARVGEEPELRVPIDLKEALAAAPLAQAGWEDITPMARRDWVFSITTAKQTETRRRRIEKACDMLACGKRRLCCFPGVKWIMRENEKSCGMWLPLPKS